jgi:hypothetical protein
VEFLVESEFRVLFGNFGAFVIMLGWGLIGIEYFLSIAEWNGVAVMEFSFGFMRLNHVGC